MLIFFVFIFLWVRKYFVSILFLYIEENSSNLLFAHIQCFLPSQNCYLHWSKNIIEKLRNLEFSISGKRCYFLPILRRPDPDKREQNYGSMPLTNLCKLYPLLRSACQIILNACTVTYPHWYPHPPPTLLYVSCSY